MGDSGVSDRTVGQLLSELDGLQVGAEIMFIAATNRRDALDPALLRAGRLDLQLLIDLPDAASRLAILGVHNQGRPLENVDLGYWAGVTEGWNGASLELLGDRAAVEAIRRYRGRGVSDPEAIRIVNDDFNYVFEVLNRSKKGARSRLVNRHLACSFLHPVLRNLVSQRNQVSGG